MNIYPITFSKTHYIDSTSHSAPALLAFHLQKYLIRSKNSLYPPVFICIGTDRIIGDSLGPVIGTMLQGNEHFPYAVYGTLTRPIHALNLETSINYIHSHHPGSPIIAIDASLGSREHLQYITVSKSSLCPGAGVAKSLTAVGDISITGIISSSESDAFLALQTVHLSKVLTLSNCITRGILLACNISLE